MVFCIDNSRGNPGSLPAPTLAAICPPAELGRNHCPDCLGNLESPRWHSCYICGPSAPVLPCSERRFPQIARVDAMPRARKGCRCRHSSDTQCRSCEVSSLGRRVPALRSACRHFPPYPPSLCSPMVARLRPSALDPLSAPNGASAEIALPVRHLDVTSVHEIEGVDQMAGLRVAQPPVGEEGLVAAWRSCHLQHRRDGRGLLGYFYE